MRDSAGSITTAVFPSAVRIYALLAKFTGDTLFRGSVGRTDLPTGNAFELIESVKKLIALDGDYKVYCGHDADTTLQHEREYNPFARK